MIFGWTLGWKNQRKYDIIQPSKGDCRFFHYPINNNFHLPGHLLGQRHGHCF